VAIFVQVGLTQVKRLFALIPGALVLCLPGCGGGGGSGASNPPPPPPPTQSYTVTPTTVTESYTAGAPAPVTVTVKASPALNGTAYLAIADAAGVIGTDAPVTLNSDGSYSLTLSPLASLTAGAHTGHIKISVCADQACKTPFAGSPVSVAFDFEVAAAPAPVTLSPTTLTGQFVAGDAFPFRLITTAVPQPSVGVNVYFTALDPSGALTPNVLWAVSGGTITLALAPMQSLPPGHYTGTVQLKVCSDGACAMQLGGSPLLVPYDFQVTPAPATGGLTALSPLPGVPAWQMFQGNAAHTGYVPVTVDPAKFATRALQMLNSFISPPVVENGIVYVASPPLLYALRESDLGVLWSYDFSALGIGGSNFPYALNAPSVSGGKVYIATSGQQQTFMFGLDANTGALDFQTPFGSQWEHYLAPTVDGGVVFSDCGSYGGMCAFDASSGAQQYFTMLQQFDEWTPAMDANYAYAYIGGQTANTPAQLNIIDRTTGAVVNSILDNSYLWAGYSMYSAPVIGAANSVVALNTGNPTNNELIDFDTSGGTIRWHIPGKYLGNPAYHAGVFYALNGNPLQLEARSETDGALLWSWSPPANTVIQGRQNDVLLTDNLAFVSTGASTYAIDLTTHQAVWSLPYGGRLALSDQGVLYLSMQDPLIPVSAWIAAINLK
jgi:outer membrane protein assembly factor BamB